MTAEMVTVAAPISDRAVRTAASLVLALALGLAAHLLGTPFGHEGSLRDLLVLFSGVGAISLLAERGELDPAHLFRNQLRCWTILFVAFAVAGALLAAEGAPNAFWDLIVSSAVLAVTALIAGFAIVAFAEQAARAAVRAFSAYVRWLHARGESSAQVARSRDPEPTHHAREWFETSSRRGPPLLP